jgi:dihydrofolate reductase
MNDVTSGATGGVALIAALDHDRAIGRAGGMPWHLPGDLARFKRLTLGKPVLMGRKTALSIGRALPGRRNLVLSRSGAAPYAAQETVHSLDEAIAAAAGAELLVIGGGEVYALALPFATRLHLTEIAARADDADTWFPAFDRTQWREVVREAHAADARHAYAFDFVEYVRAPPR